MLYNAKLYANTRNYGNYLVEQSTRLSDDLDQRLKEYLEFDGLIEWLAGELANLEDGTEVELEVPDDLGVDPEDQLWVKVDKSDDKNPKFIMWIMNDEFLFGGIDFDLAAEILYQAGQEGSTITYVTNFIGSIFGAGDPGDSGTDEDTVVAVMGAMVALAKEKGQDPKLYFDKLTQSFQSKRGSLVDFLETEFSGRAESAALTAFRQPVEASITRGLNLGQILFDAGLTLFTLGVGTAARTSLKGVAAGGKALRYAEGAAAGTRGVEAAEATTRIGKAVATMQRVFRGLPAANQLARMEKAFPVGATLQYTTKGEKTMEAVVKGYKGSKIFLATPAGANIGNGIEIANLVNASSRYKLAAGSLAKIVPGQKAAVGILAGSKAVEGTGNIDDGIPSEPGAGAKFSEIMGWYDTITADPSLYTQSLYGQGPMELATKILELKKGSGFWGNTTDQEELCLALIVLSLTPDGAVEVQKEYQKLDGGTVYAVLDDELGGDLGLFAKAYWSACMMGDSEEGSLTAMVNNMKTRITSA